MQIRPDRTRTQSGRPRSLPQHEVKLPIVRKLRTGGSSIRKVRIVRNRIRKNHRVVRRRIRKLRVVRSKIARSRSLR